MLDKPIRQRRLAMIDVCDDRKIANVFHLLMQNPVWLKTQDEEFDAVESAAKYIRSAVAMSRHNALFPADCVRTNTASIKATSNVYWQTNSDSNSTTGMRIP